MQKKRIYRILKWFFGIVAGFFLLVSFLLYIFKDDIIEMAISEVNDNLKADIQVSSVDLTFWSTFPNLSLDFNHVFIQDAVPGSTELDTLLYSDRIRCKVNPFDIWREEYKVKKLEVSPGVAYLKVDESGNNNYDILKDQDSTSDGAVDLELEEVLFENFRFNYINKATSQVYRTRIDEMLFEGNLSESVFTMQAKSNLQISEARSGNMSLVSNKPAVLDIRVNVNTDSGTVIIPQSTILIAQLPFNFEGAVQPDSFAFSLTGKDIGIEDAASNLAMKETKDIKNFQGTGKLLFNLDIQGTMESTSPVEVQCDFGVENGTLRDPNSGITLSDLSLNGMYSNIGGPKKELVLLKEIGFKTKGGPFKGNLKITNFEAPIYRGNADGLINLAVVRSLFKLTGLQRLTGTVDVSSNFVVQTEILPTDKVQYHVDRCEGRMRMNNVSAQLVDDKRLYKNVEGLVYLRNDKVGIDDVTLSIGSSDFKINGVFSKVVDYFSDRGSLVADVDIQSKNIDLADLGSDSKEDKMKHERVFILPNDIEGDVYLNVDRMKYEKHYFYRLKGNMSLLNRKIHFPRVSVSNGGADVVGSLTIEEQRPEWFVISSQLVSNNIQFNKLFKEWDNFKQDVIKSHNISGMAKANVRFKAPFDLRTGIISNSIEAKVGIQIINGHLRGVETFKEITQSLKETPSARLAIGKENINAFEKKLLDLKFEKLENTLLIRDGVLTIPSMSVESNALDIELSGKHTFDNKIDYRFGFRFRDLKQKEYSEFGEIVDDGTGKFVFMRMYGDLYNPNIEWDKASNKANKKENREQAKRDAKSILKSEFGLFKSDTTVQEYIQERRPHEEIIVDIHPTEENDTLIENNQPKKNTRLNRWINKLKQESEEENKNKEEIIWE